jgi:iron complex outermembrane receptor protein
LPVPLARLALLTSLLTTLPAVALVLAPARAAAQTADARDTTRADSARSQPLPAVRVSVTRVEERVDHVPWAVGVVGTREVRRGRPTLDLGEALAGIPGVYVASRYNYALDSRVSIRGFGSRANFGLRGVKVLLDGIPQTLPDGQSQITNIELGVIDRVEVLRGSTSSLYGNGSAGVLAFSTDMSAPAPFQQSVRVTGGAFGTLKLQARASGRAGPATGMLALSRLATDGPRQFNTAEVRQLNTGIDYALDPATTASLRLNLADMPEALNPGALTEAEYLANPDSAARFNVLRGADKRITQNQLALTLRRQPRDGEEYVVSVYGSTRDVRNALALAAPPPAAPENGTYSTLDRKFGGIRASGVRRLWNAERAPSLTAGLDVQRMHDIRQNRRSTGGRPTQPTDTLLLDQAEAVTSIGPFAQIAWTPATRLLVSAGGRYDRVRFTADDRFLSDGDESGERTMPAWSGHVGVSLTGVETFAPYANISTSFETPTTTELQARPDASGGFNPELDPQRAVSLELGARGALGGRLGYSVSVYRARVRDAIVQFLETNGRAFFRNAGETEHDGVEVGASLRLVDALSIEGAYTYSRFRFGEYRQQRGATVDTLDGNRLPGVPEHFARIGLRSRLGRGFVFDVDHTISSAVYADDRNELRIEGWGPGILAARLSWSGTVGRARWEPFVSAENLFDRTYVSAVTVNGAVGRVREPGAPRAIYAGMEIGWAAGR